MKTQKLIKDFLKGMRYFGENISLIINSILLTVVYIIGIGITSIVAKTMGKRFLLTNSPKKLTTYWTKLDLKKDSISDYYRQF